MQGDILFEMDRVRKRFGCVEALEDVSLAIYQGQIMGVIGDNGSGKTTLLRIISGAEQPDSGHMRMGGRPYAPACPVKPQEIFCLMNSSGLIAQMSVAENIMRYRYPRTGLGLIRWKQVYRQAQALLDQLGVEMDPYARVAQLPQRRRQLLELVCAYGVDARMVLYDEPDFSHDDPDYALMAGIFQRITRRGGSVVITTHRLETLMRLADHVTILDKGKVGYSAPACQTSLGDLLGRMARAGAPSHAYPKLPVRLGTPVVEFDRVSTALGLKDFSFTLRRGEIVGMAALSREMRSGPLEALGGLCPLAQGSLRIHGSAVSMHSPAQALRFGIGYLAESRFESALAGEFPLGPNITMGNLAAIGRHGVLRRSLEHKAARKYVRMFAIRTPSLSAPVESLSTGNQQKVLLSRLLFAQNRILLMEEPTRALDEAARNEVYNFMNMFVTGGGTILVSSSHVSEMAGMCDRIVAFRSDGSYSIKNDRENMCQHTLSYMAIDNAAPT